MENKRWWATAEPAIGQVIFTSHCPRLIRLFTVYSVPPLSPAFTTTVPSIYWSTHNDSIYLADLGLLEVLFNFRYRPSANFTSLSGPCRQMTHGGALITDSLSLYLWNSIINTQENKKIKLHVPILSYLFTLWDFLHSFLFSNVHVRI